MQRRRQQRQGKAAAGTDVVFWDLDSLKKQLRRFLPPSPTCKLLMTSPMGRCSAPDLQTNQPEVVRLWRETKVRGLRARGRPTRGTQHAAHGTWHAAYVVNRPSGMVTIWVNPYHSLPRRLAHNCPTWVMRTQPMPSLSTLKHARSKRSQLAPLPALVPLPFTCHTQRYSEEDIDFQERVYAKSGLSSTSTYLPPSLNPAFVGNGAFAVEEVRAGMRVLRCTCLSARLVAPGFLHVGSAG